MMVDKIPKRVIYVGSPELFSKGASAIHIMKMCQAIARLGVDTELMIPANRSAEEIYSYYGVEQNFKITHFPYFANTSLRNIIHGTAAALYTKLKRGGYDVVVTRNIVFTYVATKFFGIPTVYDAHHPLVKGASGMFNSFKDSERLIRFSVNSAGLGRIYLDLGLEPEKLVVAHNGVDLGRFENALSKEEARKKLGLPLGGNIICYSGNIYEGRGVQFLIDAALELPRVMFLIVGGRDQDVERYRALAGEKGVSNVLLTGFVPHVSVADYLHASDILVMPYTSSMTIRGGTNAALFTSPIKLFEYMAAGRPIVASALPSVSEVLRDGENAVLTCPDSFESLTAGLKKVLGDKGLADRLSHKSRADVRSYTWENRARKLLGIN